MNRGLAALAGALALTGSGVLAWSQANAATSVRVSMTEFKFALSKSSVPKGAVTFKLANKGSVSHDFKITGKKSPEIAPGKAGSVKVTFKSAGRYKYTCTLPGHAQAGMKGTLTVR